MGIHGWLLRRRPRHGGLLWVHSTATVAATSIVVHAVHTWINISIVAVVGRWHGRRCSRREGRRRLWCSSHVRVRAGLIVVTAGVATAAAVAVARHVRLRNGRLCRVRVAGRWWHAAVEIVRWGNVAA